MTRRIMRELEDSRMDKVAAKDIIKEGDWIIKWSEHSKSLSGFELYTPENFDPESESAPLGGLMLSALYFIIENGDPDFGKDVVSAANDLARQMQEMKDRQEEGNRSIN